VKQAKLAAYRDADTITRSSFWQNLIVIATLSGLSRVQLVKAFFVVSKKTHFERALALMAIYDDSKTSSMDEQVENLVGGVKAILKKGRRLKRIIPKCRSCGQVYRCLHGRC
jgi:predicted Zn-ribbon and HTH transcriptional regulator